jgi:hypothetical protein
MGLVLVVVGRSALRVAAPNGLGVAAEAHH